MARPSDQSLIVHEQPKGLRDPALVFAFAGWNDAGSAATGAIRWMREHWDAKLVAEVDPEEFYDFQQHRPQVEIVDGDTRRVTWPRNRIYRATPPAGERDVLLLLGLEPSMRWRSFTTAIADFARGAGCEFAVGLGALLADVAHTRPVPITGTANADLVGDLGLSTSRYEGPTGVVGVVHEATERAGMRSASLWAAVPHYLGGPGAGPNPKAAVALVERASALLGIFAEPAELRAQAIDWERSATEAVAGDEDVAAYVSRLEARADEEDDEDDATPNLADLDVPSGDALAAELQRFLREQRGGDA